MTIADISAAHELDQARFIALDLSKWPKVKQWLHKMIDETPEMLESAQTMRRFAANYLKRQERAKL